MTARTVVDRAAGLIRSEKGRFLLVGGWNTLFGYLAFAATYLLFHRTLGTTQILVVAYVVSMFQSFLTQKMLVFRVGGSPLPQLLRFCASNTLIFLVNLLALPLTVESTGMNPLAAQALFVAVSTVAAYYLHKHFSFL